MSKPKEFKDINEKLMTTIEGYVWSMDNQTLREWITNELTSIYFSDTITQEQIDDFIEEWHEERIAFEKDKPNENIRN